jgi:hypothetical protein
VRKGNGKVKTKPPFVMVRLDIGQRKLAAGKDAATFATFLEVEHMRHGATMNGKLKAPHRQLAACGIRKANIARAVAAAVTHGLVVITQHGGMRTATLYWLTYATNREASASAGKPKTRRPARPKVHNAERTT